VFYDRVRFLSVRVDNLVTPNVSQFYLFILSEGAFVVCALCLRLCDKCDADASVTDAARPCQIWKTKKCQCKKKNCVFLPLFSPPS
jgi:hypothetical protein